MVVGVGSKNIAGSFIDVIEQQGWQGLWAGNMINMLRIVPTQAIDHVDRKSTRLNSSHYSRSRMPSSA